MTATFGPGTRRSRANRRILLTVTTVNVLNMLSLNEDNDWRIPIDCGRADRCVPVGTATYLNGRQTYTVLVRTIAAIFRTAPKVMVLVAGTSLYWSSHWLIV